jgi:hypothetical protein
MGALCFVFGVIVLLYGLGLDSAARDFKSARQCLSGNRATDCAEQRAIEITAVSTGRSGGVNTVDFLDQGSPHESHLGPGAKYTSVLQAGASGTATLWRGKYTNLDVAGIDFVTDENPVAQQGLWILFGVIGIGFAVILWTGWLAWNVMNRRTLVPAAVDPPSAAMLR